MAELDKRIVGYQISTLYQDGAHLARLATIPEMQGMGIGGALVGEMIEHFLRRGITTLTVNTQRSNQQSQRLYQRFKWEIVAGLDRDRWLLTQAEIRCWIAGALSGERPEDQE